MSMLRGSRSGPVTPHQAARRGSSSPDRSWRHTSTSRGLSRSGERQRANTYAMAAHRLVVRVVLLMAAAAGAAAFGVRKGAPAEFCFRRYDPKTSAPFTLGTVAAIHLGNTKSCVAGYDDYPGTNYYHFCIPSWIAFTDNGTLFGEAARNHAALSPGTAVSGFKRLIGARLEHEVAKRTMELAPYNLTQDLGRLFVQVDGRAEKFSVHHLAGILMSELKHMAEAHLGHDIENAVVTVPLQLTFRLDMEFAGREHAGFRAVKVVDEQVAAAAAYGHHKEQGDHKAILVFHLGGRTAGATVFNFIDRTAFVIAARSDPFLGGDDFTGRVVEHFAELIKKEHDMDVREDKNAMLRLTAACERAKQALSGAGQEETLVEVESLLAGGANFTAPLTRAKFEELNHDLFERAMALVDEAVMRRGKPRVIDEIVVVGGSTRIPKVRQLLKDYFHGKEPNYSERVEPDDAVVHGAAQISRPEAARYLEECFDYWHAGAHGDRISFI
ncbi:hypothetical protein ACP70R_035944 [Stipagrostis hirtigluma subsp. patula]